MQVPLGWRYHQPRRLSLLPTLLFACACVLFQSGSPSHLTLARPVARGAAGDIHILEREDLISQRNKVASKEEDVGGYLPGVVRGEVVDRRRWRQLLQQGGGEEAAACQVDFSSIDFGELHGSCNVKEMTKEGCCLPLLRIIGPSLLFRMSLMPTACLEGLFAAMTDQGIDPNELLDFCLPDVSPRGRMGHDYLTQAQQSAAPVGNLLNDVLRSAAKVYGQYNTLASEPAAAYVSIEGSGSSPSQYDDYGSFDYGQDYGVEESAYYPRGGYPGGPLPGGSGGGGY